MSFFKKIFGSNNTKKILYVSSPLFIKGKESSSHDYFTYIISELTQKLRKIDKSIDFVLKVPNSENDFHTQQIDFIEDALAKINEYKCIIVAPFNRDKIYKKFEQWKEHINDDKLFFIDQGFPKEEVDEIKGVDRPGYAQADWKQGGFCAGESMAFFFKGLSDIADEKILHPNILIVEGTVGSKERIVGFKEGIKSLNKNGFQINPNYPGTNIMGLYDKTITIDKFKIVFDAYLKENKVINGVFCCNDEMALGVNEVLQDNTSRFNELTSGHLNATPIIIGFDGIKDVISLIEGDNIFMYDTILADADQQINGIVNLITQSSIKNKRLDKFEKFIKSYRKVFTKRFAII